MAVDCQISDLHFSSPEPLAHGENDHWMSIVSCVSCILYRQQLTGPRSAVGKTCLATDASLAADPGVASSIPAQSHTFVEIDHEIISMVILLPSAESFKKGCCQ